jgi:DeoR/GlpR family transcriptional regulator of sugar metabolism
MYHDSKTNTILNKEIKSIESITTPMSFVWAFDRLPEWPYTAAGTMAQKSRLLIEQRRRRMLDLVGQDGQATVAELARLFSISAVTARGDLDALASIGSIVRSHGGAVRCLDTAQDYPLRTKEALHRDEKCRIGRAAAELVGAGETIILDSGTTTVEIARHLKMLKTQSVTVITNALNIALELADTPGISLIMVGGLLRPLSCSFVGPQAEAMMNEFHADRLFLAVDGFDLHTGLSTPDMLEAQLNNMMMRSAREVTVVADFSKLDRRAISKIGPFERIHRLITDTGAPKEFIETLRQKGIEVIEV